MASAPWLATGQVAGRWIDAGELEIGDDVRNADGFTGDVESMVVVPDQQWMYNLTVETAHTFFVGQQGWLVHNVCSSLIKKLPKDPLDLGGEWSDVTASQMRNNTQSMEFQHSETGLKIRFDRGVPGQPGYHGIDHYHIYNPHATNKGDKYLDINGQPTPHNSKASHIDPDKF